MFSILIIISYKLIYKIIIYLTLNLWNILISKKWYNFNIDFLKKIFIQFKYLVKIITFLANSSAI